MLNHGKLDFKIQKPRVTVEFNDLGGGGLNVQYYSGSAPPYDRFGPKGNKA